MPFPPRPRGSGPPSAARILLLTKVLHANWSNGLIHLWAEEPELLTPAGVAAPGVAGATVPGQHPLHPFAASPESVRKAVCGPADPGVLPAADGELLLRLPTLRARPLPSTTLARSLGRTSDEEETHPEEVTLATFRIPTLTIGGNSIAAVLFRVAELLMQPGEARGAEGPAPAIAGASFQYFTEVVRLAMHLLAQQRFVPMLVQTIAGDLKGTWAPWVSDAASADRVARLVSGMPASARAAVDHLRHEPWPVTEEFLSAVVDAECRRTLIRENFVESIEERIPAADPHVAWLSGLLAGEDTVPGLQQVKQEMAKRVRGWIGALEERGASSAWRLLLRLVEPTLAPAAGDQTPDPEAPVWSISFHLQSVDQPGLVLDAEDVWLLTGDSVAVMGRRLEQPQELLLGELGRASRYFPRLEQALEESCLLYTSPSPRD